MNNKITDKTSVSKQISSFSNKLNLMQGWECPRCGKINAPWKGQCDCKKEEKNNWHGLPEDVYNPGNIEINNYPKFINTFEIDPCEYCSNNPENGGSGVCNCILGDMYKVTC